jgi:hypothetical protein
MYQAGVCVDAASGSGFQLCGESQEVILQSEFSGFHNHNDATSGSGFQLCGESQEVILQGEFSGFHNHNSVNSKADGFELEDEEEWCSAEPLQSGFLLPSEDHCRSDSAGPGFVIPDEEEKQNQQVLSAPLLYQQPGRGLEQVLVKPFLWAETCLKAVSGFLQGGWLHGSVLKLSTHCSGIGSPEMAMEQLAANSMSCLGFQLRIDCVAACDTSHHCQTVLLERMGSGHVFSDIFGYFAAWDGALQPPDEVVRALRATVSLQAPRECKRHGQQCQQPNADIDVTGSPCQPWSRYGNRKGTAEMLIYSASSVKCYWFRFASL